MTRDCWGIARSKARPDISGSKSTTRWRLRSKSTFSAPETLGAERRAVGALFFDIHAGVKRRGRAAKRFIPFSVPSETAANRRSGVFLAERHYRTMTMRPESGPAKRPRRSDFVR